MRKNKIMKIISVYMLLSAFVCVFNLFVVLFKYNLDNLAKWITIVVPGLLIFATIINNIKILVSEEKDQLNRALIFNGVLSTMQVFTLRTEGFFYEYTQGSNLFLFVNFEHLTKEVVWGGYIELLALNFYLQFNPSDNTLVGVNLLALLIAFISFWIASNIIRQQNTSK